MIMFLMQASEITKKIEPILRSHREVKLAYLFGSHVTGDIGGTSDYDFAFYLDEQDTQKIYDLKFTLLDEISRALKTDKIDVVILNITESPELKYNTQVSGNSREI
jgi:predicted nucleotidyltransferase